MAEMNSWLIVLQFSVPLHFCRTSGSKDILHRSYLPFFYLVTLSENTLIYFVSMVMSSPKQSHCAVVEKSSLCLVLFYYSHKSSLVFKTKDRFWICWSWLFQNTPYMYNLTKFWLIYLRLKTHDTWYHSYIFKVFDLTKKKTIEIWTFCVKSNW